MAPLRNFSAAAAAPAASSPVQQKSGRVRLLPLGGGRPLLWSPSALSPTSTRAPAGSTAPLSAAGNGNARAPAFSTGPYATRVASSIGPGSSAGLGAGAGGAGPGASGSFSTSGGSMGSSNGNGNGAGNGMLPPSATAGPQAGGTKLFDVPSFLGSRHAFQAQVRELARGDVTPMDLSHLVTMGKKVTLDGLLENAAFLSRELPVRLAKRIVELESLPYGLGQTLPVQTVRQWYEDSLRELVSVHPPTTAEEEAAFVSRLGNIFERHRDVVPMLARGVLEIKGHVIDMTHGQGCPFLTQFLDRFYLSRIGIRILIAQHIALHSPVDGYSGIIALKMDPEEVIRLAIEDAGRLCEFTCGDVPPYNVTVAGEWAGAGACGGVASVASVTAAAAAAVAAATGNSDGSAAEAHVPVPAPAPAPEAGKSKDKGRGVLEPTATKAGVAAAVANHNRAADVASSMGNGESAAESAEAAEERRRIAYVPSHLHHMVFELMKNSMRAVVEKHGSSGLDLPPIEVTIVYGEHEVGVRISDQGGGIGRGDMEKIWTYLHTTAPPSVQKDLIEQATSGQGLTSAPLAGFGYGLPLSRLFARYFGGDLQLNTVDGYGTDAFLWINKLSADAVGGVKGAHQATETALHGNE